MKDIIAGWLNFSTTVNSIQELETLHQSFSDHTVLTQYCELLDYYFLNMGTRTVACVPTNLTFLSHSLKTELTTTVHTGLMTPNEAKPLIDIVEAVLLGPATYEQLTPYFRMDALPAFTAFTEVLELDPFTLNYVLNVGKQSINCFKVDNTFPQKVWISNPLLFIGEEEDVTEFKRRRLDTPMLIMNESFKGQFKKLFKLNDSTEIYNITDKYDVFENSYEEDKEYMFKHIVKKLNKEESYYFDFEDIRILIHKKQLYIPFMSYDQFNQSHSENQYQDYISSLKQAKHILTGYQVDPIFITYAPNLYTDDKAIMKMNYEMLSLFPKITTFYKEIKQFNDIIPNKVLLKSIICGIPIYHLQFVQESNGKHTLCQEMVLYFIHQEPSDITAKQLTLELLMHEYEHCQIQSTKEPHPFKFFGASLFN